MRFRSVLTAATVVVVAALTLSACTSDPLAQQYRNGDGKNYIAGDGAITEIGPGDRAAPVSFRGTDENGNEISSSKFAGEVVVLNFWYAGCAPCRAEAPALEDLHRKYDGKGAQFLGVNVRDQAQTAAAFAETFGVTYPSIIDISGNVQLALSGQVAPNAVPTTLVIDKQGRVAARILGQVTEPSILDTLIRDAIAESR